MGITSVRLFALIIGINHYQNFKTLRGAVADADAITNYLLELGVPPNHIINLRDGAATRNAIIRCFRVLQDNPDIQRGEPIFIYYAGHGSQMNSADGKTQAILPQDTGPGSLGKIIYPIPFRTIIALLDDLAGEKGDNISIVLDCGYALSGNARDFGGSIARVADVTGGFPSSLDQEIVSHVSWSTRASSLQHDPHSHVRLMACAANEAAWERYGRGVFTKAFLESLRDVGTVHSTYKELMKSLPIHSNQTPQFEGNDESRISFNRKMARGGDSSALKSKQAEPLNPAFQTAARVPLFALIVGIDHYKDKGRVNLKGAVADAEAIKEFLLHELAVPMSHIIHLIDQAATRGAIVRGFRDLMTDPRIRIDDPIFIYFAGSGYETDAPPEWSVVRDKVQGILPYDWGQDASGSHINNLAHHTIFTLVNDIARAKGNNIVLVFDSSHSGGVYASHSHVLLAACGAREVAKEFQGHGSFTAALLDTLRQRGVENTTYSGLINLLPSLPSQSPQCTGYYQHRRFFSKEVMEADRFFRIEQQGDTYILKAGLAQGITIGSEFEMYDDHIKPHLLGVMRVKTSQAMSATLEPIGSGIPHSSPRPAHARQVRCGEEDNPTVHFTHGLEKLVSIEQVQKALDPNARGNLNMRLRCEVADAAEIIVDVDPKHMEEIIFSTGIKFAEGHELDLRYRGVDASPESISRVLLSAARWNWHFKRKGPVSSTRVRLEFTRLNQIQNEFDEDAVSIMMPTGENMNRDGVVDMIVNPDQLFGFRIVNDTPRDLYPYVFRFDVSDQSIQTVYLPPTGKDSVESPLCANSSLAFGYGLSDSPPYAFHLREGQEIDIDFLKVFFTTSPTDLGSVAQASPFSGPEAPTGQTGMGDRAHPWSSAMPGPGSEVGPQSSAMPEQDVETDIVRPLKGRMQPGRVTPLWGTTMVAVVQRRGSNEIGSKLQISNDLRPGR